MSIADESKLPGDFIIMERKVDRRALIDYLKGGGEVEGCELVQGESLRIR